MMSDAIAAALLVFLAGAIGSVSSLVGLLIQHRATHRREVQRMAVDVGLQEWQRHQEIAKERGGGVFPPSIFVYFSSGILKLIDEDRLDESSYGDLVTRRNLLARAIDDENRERGNVPPWESTE